MQRVGASLIVCSSESPSHSFPRIATTAELSTIIWAILARHTEALHGPVGDLLEPLRKLASYLANPLRHTFAFYSRQPFPDRFSHRLCHTLAGKLRQLLSQTMSFFIFDIQAH